MRRRYFTLDVFTTRRFAGNPLAVVLEPQGLDDAAMQAIAQEFNLSETVFVFPPADPARRADIRIFTPSVELPFAGHPTVGTAVLLALIDLQGKAGEAAFTLGEKVGPVPCVARIEGAADGTATFALPRLPARVGEAANAATLAAALGIHAADIGAPGLAPAVWSAGVPYALVPVRDRRALDRVAPDRTRWGAAFAGAAGGHSYVFAADPAEPGHDWAARMFTIMLGGMEDPATGSAAASLCGYLAAHVLSADGTHRAVIEQGYAMGRPSQIELTMIIERGALARATIGGGVVIVSEGTIEA